MPDEVKVEEKEVVAPQQDTETKSVSEEQKTDSKPQKEEVVDAKTIPVDVAQKRIDRMYARLQQEREGKLAAIRENDKLRSTQHIGDGNIDDDEPQPRGLTREELRAELDARDLEERVKRNENMVFLEHPTALNDDGSFNVNDQFLQIYTRIGRENPQLVTMPNGPLIAQAMAEKELGISYTRGRQDEAEQLHRSTVNNYTAVSTGKPPKVAATGKLSDAEKKVAARQGISEQEYLANKVSTKVVQKDWSVK